MTKEATSGEKPLPTWAGRRETTGSTNSGAAYKPKWTIESNRNNQIECCTATLAVGTLHTYNQFKVCGIQESMKFIQEAVGFNRY